MRSPLLIFMDYGSLRSGRCSWILKSILARRRRNLRRTSSIKFKTILKRVFPWKEICASWCVEIYKCLEILAHTEEAVTPGDFRREGKEPRLIPGQCAETKGKRREA